MVNFRGSTKGFHEYLNWFAGWLHHQSFYFQQVVGSWFRSLQVDSRRIGALGFHGGGRRFCLRKTRLQDMVGPHSVDAAGIRKKQKNMLPPGRLTWNLQITHLERKMIFQTPMIMFHVNLQGCTFYPTKTHFGTFRLVVDLLHFLPKKKLGNVEIQVGQRYDQRYYLIDSDSSKYVKPRCSMGLEYFTYIWPKSMVNVGR